MSLCNNNQMGDFTVSQSRRFTETMGVGPLSVMKRLKWKTKHGSPALLRWCVSITSPIRITDRLNHSESNIDLHKSAYKCIVLAVCHVY